MWFVFFSLANFKIYLSLVLYTISTKSPYVDFQHMKASYAYSLSVFGLGSHIWLFFFMSLVIFDWKLLIFLKLNVIIFFQIWIWSWAPPERICGIFFCSFLACRQPKKFSKKKLPAWSLFDCLSRSKESYEFKLQLPVRICGFKRQRTYFLLLSMSELRQASFPMSFPKY